MFGGEPSRGGRRNQPLTPKAIPSVVGGYPHAGDLSEKVFSKALPTDLTCHWYRLSLTVHMGSQMKMRFLCLAGLMLAAMVGQVQAGVITVASASTNMGSGYGTSLSNTINGVGLSAFPRSLS
jgi:hypothetical protein